VPNASWRLDCQRRIESLPPDLVGTPDRRPARPVPSGRPLRSREAPGVTRAALQGCALPPARSIRSNLPAWIMTTPTLESGVHPTPTSTEEREFWTQCPLESPGIGYAPAECRTKQWATESLIEGWFPPYRGERDCFTVARNANESRTPNAERRRITARQSPAACDPRSPLLDHLVGSDHPLRHATSAVGCNTIRTGGFVCLDIHPHRRNSKRM